MPLHRPVLIVIVPELLQGCLKLPDGLEAPDPGQVFLRSSNEMPGAAIAFRRPDKGWR